MNVESLCRDAVCCVRARCVARRNYLMCFCDGLDASCLCLQFATTLSNTNA